VASKQYKKVEDKAPATGPTPSAAATASAERLVASKQYKEVEELVAQYDATVEMLLNDNFQLLYENEFGRFEIHQPAGSGTWFEYRMTVNVDAPLPQCLSTVQELELMSMAQPMFGEPMRIGPESGWLSTQMTRFKVLLFKIELVFETLRVRDRRSGFCLESIRSTFPANGRHVPEKHPRSIRPWSYTASCWVPRGGGKSGTMLVQVTRVDAMMHLPQFVLNAVLRQFAGSFMKDLRVSADKAVQDGSPWAKKVAEDKLGFYQDLKNVDDIAAERAEVSKMPERAFFEDRPWRLRPKPHDTNPPVRT